MAKDGGGRRGRWLRGRRTPGAPGGPGFAVRVACVIAGMLLSGVVVWDSSGAAFSSQTGNPASNWAAGSVSIGDDDGGAAMFSASGLQPGDSGSKCIAVTYTGSAAASVRVYAQALTGTLGAYLNVTLEQGVNGTFASCPPFAAEVTAPTVTMSSLAAARTNFGTGFGTWAPTGATQTKVYRVSWSLAADNAAASRSAGLTLRWEAQA